ncbi:MAG: phosphatidate cytidylyltransferase [Chloroflexota bacterium]
MLNNNLLAFIITFAASILWLRINDFAAHRGWISSWLSRKFIHIGTGPLFVICWVLFDSSFSSRLLAAIIPLLITVQFLLVGLGVIKDEASVKALSRSGDRREILRGPLFYGIIFVLITLIFWTTSPIGIVALMLMCGGDGLAEILGRLFGKRSIPWSEKKTYLGSLGMLVGGWTVSVAVLAVFVSLNVFAGPLSTYLLPITLIAFVGMLVETLPMKDIDNFTITIAAIILGFIVF